ncbi:MAG: hypothetical protein AAF518_27040 [Spirochaetota bacterium]
MKRIVVLYLSSYLLLTSVPTLLAHHTPDMQGSGASGINPILYGNTGMNFTPRPYFALTSELSQGARGRQDILETGFFAEMFFWKGRLSWNFSYSFYYYSLQNKQNVAKYGKPFLGSKFVPFLTLPYNLVFFLENRVGFPTGQNWEKFTGGNYYVLDSSALLGKTFSKWSVFLRIGGMIPERSIYTFSKPSLEASLPYLLQRGSLVEQETLLLKKVSYAHFLFQIPLAKQWSSFLGYFYRTPYNGVELASDSYVLGLQTNLRQELLLRAPVSQATVLTMLQTEIERERRRYTDSFFYSEPIGMFRREPKVFREVFAGLVWNFYDSYSLQLSVKYPLQREKYYRLYANAVSLSFFMMF